MDIPVRQTPVSLLGYEYRVTVYVSALASPTLLRCATSGVQQSTHAITLTCSRTAIEVKFCTAKRTHVFVVPVKFDVNLCNESPLWGEKPDFWPVSKFNTGSLLLRGILPVIIITGCATAQHCYNGDFSFLWEKWKL